MEALRTYLGSELLFHLAMALAQFLGVLLMAWVVKRLLSTVGRKLISRTDTDLDDIILKLVVDHIKWLAVVVGAYLATEEITKATDDTNLMARQLLGYAEGIIFVCFVFVLTLLLIRAADSSVKYYMEQHARRTSSKLNEALLPLINRIINIIIALIAIIIVLDHFGQDVSSLVVSLGVGSLAIALAAQDTLANMIAGFVIIMDRPFRVGDRIQLPTGEMGDVFEIGIRSTKILDFDNNLIVMPNAELVKSRIINYSYPEEFVRVIVEIGVAYGTEVDKAKLIMTGLAKQHPDILADPIPEVFLLAFGDSSLNLRLVARTDDYRKKFRTESVLREKVYKAFQEEGVEIPFPQRVVHMADGASKPVESDNVQLQNPQKRAKARRKSV